MWALAESTLLILLLLLVLLIIIDDEDVIHQATLHSISSYKRYRPIDEHLLDFGAILMELKRNVSYKTRTAR